MRTFASVTALGTLLACSNPLGPAEVFEFRGSVSYGSEGQDTIVVALSAINATAWSRTFAWGPWCPPLLDVHVYASTDARPGPAWRYLEHWRDGCLAALRPPVATVVAPGDSVVHEVRFATAAVVGDSLPAGRYDFTAVVDRVLGAQPGSVPEVELGQLLLEQPASPAPRPGSSTLIPTAAPPSDLSGPRDPQARSSRGGRWRGGARPRPRPSEGWRLPR